jgi:putative FmdB family regulatory protein
MDFLPMHFLSDHSIDKGVMPVFSYICKACGEKFDLLEGVTQEKASMECPKCGSTKIEKTFASFGVGKPQSSSSGMSGGGCSSCCPGGTCPMM